MVARVANVVVRGLTPKRWLEQGDPKLGFLVEGRTEKVEKVEN